MAAEAALMPCASLSKGCNMNVDHLSRYGFHGQLERKLGCHHGLTPPTFQEGPAHAAFSNLLPE